MNSNTKRQYSLSMRVDDLNTYIRNYVCAIIPNVHRDLRIHLLDEMYMLVKNIYYVTYNKGNIRMKYLIELKVNISMIDNIFSQLMNILTSNTKSIKVAISKLNDIKNIIYGWIFNEENKKN